ncbi:hypothetical protein DSO57_1030855 [Entomophthora muscae]|uniref:Uncharacterized protein n=1 Tax=Entomophthora muscae TaxID=34485 RepID=A0ACC2TMI2_9FUNG|nr:hypothetical protein DSO57_1030855 [Entomophthora muscae]
MLKKDGTNSVVAGVGLQEEGFVSIGHDVLSDKLLSTMLIEKPQLQDLNPGIPRAASPRGQPPAVFWAQSRALGKSNSPTLMPPTLKVPVNATNWRAGSATDPGITWAHAEGETENLPIEHGPHRDNQSRNLTREFKHSQFEPSNRITPTIDATKDREDLVSRKTWAKEICESFTMTDEHTYTLDCQEYAHCHSCNKVT